MRFIIIFLLFTLTSCSSVYDEKRGVFVSSDIKLIKLTNEKISAPIMIDEFSYPNPSNAYTSSYETMVPVGDIMMLTGGSHTYIFDTVDKNNLRQTLINSLSQTGNRIIEPNKEQSIEVKQIVVDIEFVQTNMIKGDWGSTDCLLNAIISIKTADTEIRKNTSIIGKDAWSVSGAKNDAIKQLVEIVWSELVMFEAKTR